MSLPSGKYDRKVAFFATSASQNASGDMVLTLGAPVYAWAAVSWGTAGERREASGVEAARTCTFRVRSCAALRAMDAGDRIEFDGVSWGITGRASVGAQGHELEFTTRAWLAGQAVAA